MSLEDFLNKISINLIVKDKVIKTFNEHNYEFFMSLLDKVKNKEDFEKIKNEFNDSDGMIFLTAYCLEAMNVKTDYEEKGISDEIYYDTFKCFSRFINETYVATNRYEFDRYWWCNRQLNMKLFRVGTLEYEILDNGDEISIHIPSDSILTTENVNKSIKESNQFLRKYLGSAWFLKFSCSSWLLSPCLKELLNSDSNILNFQKKFKIEKTFEDNSFYFFAFKTYSKDIKSFKEETSLQKKLKKYLLDGNKFLSAYGTLIMEENL